MRVVYCLLGAAIALPAAAETDTREAARPRFLQGVAALQSQDYERAIAAFSAALRLDPANVRAWHARALAYQRQGKNDHALADYDQAIRIHPDAILHVNRGMIHAERKDYDKAIADFGEAIRLDPAYARAYENRARAYEDKGDHKHALADLDEVVRLDPHNTFARTDRGDVHALRGDYDKAMADYQATIRLDPTCSTPYNSLAWLWATCPRAELRDGKRAVACAHKACELTWWKCAEYLDTLAAAYAEAGDFAHAVEWAEKALAVEKKDIQISRSLPEDFNAASLTSVQRQAVKRRLELYKQGKPYRDTPSAGTR